MTVESTPETEITSYSQYCIKDFSSYFTSYMEINIIKCLKMYIGKFIVISRQKPSGYRVLGLLDVYLFEKFSSSLSKDSFVMKISTNLLSFILSLFISPFLAVTVNSQKFYIGGFLGNISSPILIDNNYFIDGIIDSIPFSKDFFFALELTAVKIVNVVCLTRNFLFILFF